MTLAVFGLFAFLITKAFDEGPLAFILIVFGGWAFVHLYGVVALWRRYGALAAIGAWVLTASVGTGLYGIWHLIHRFGNRSAEGAKG